jgi:malonyl-CoA/methylmalonyl-CoA synthetase
VETFREALQQSFAVNRDRAALIFTHRSYSFRDLEASAERVAGLFQSRGVHPGDRILLFLESKEPFLLAYLGAIWCGAVPLPLNPGYKPPELSYFADDSRACCIVYDATTSRVVHAVAHQCATLQHHVSADELLAAPSAARVRLRNAASSEPALLLYSSGTTGEPKGVLHTQGNLASAVRAIVEVWRFTSDDVLTNVLPLFHIHGLSFATNVSLCAGGTMLVGDRFHPTQTLDLIDRSTVFMGVPAYYYSFLKRDEFAHRAARWKQLRLVTCGSAPLRTDVLPALESILKRPIVNRYGMTECHVLTSLPLHGPWPHGSVGLPLSGIEVMVRTSCGTACKPGEDGHVFARGTNLFQQYWQRPRATADSFDDSGWFDTGDVGHFDEAGFLTLVGRSKELIIVGGFNVYPAVVERVIQQYPGVREAAVVGVGDAGRGERVVAFVVPDDQRFDAAGCRTFCLQHLADYQCPTRIELISDLPRNAMGKVLKQQLVSRLGS